MGEFYDSLGLDSLTNFYLPQPGSAKGYPPNHFVFSLILMMIGDGLVRTYRKGYEGVDALNCHVMETTLTQDPRKSYTLDADAFAI